MRRLLTGVGVGLSAVVASLALAATPTFKPDKGDYVVLALGADMPVGPAAVGAEHSWQAARDSAAALIARARAERDPRYFGRAEALLLGWTSRSGAPADLLILEADILQNRHEFKAARVLLDRAISSNPLLVRARLMRATVLIVQGQPQLARSDCAAVFSYGDLTLGSVCLAQVIASAGKLDHAADLIRSVDQGAALPSDVRAWIHASLADIAARQGNAPLAEKELRAGLEAQPADETLRLALADLLLARRSATEALALTDLPRPTIGLLIRRAFAEAILRDAHRTATLEQVRELIDLETRRGERVHLREEALLALGTGRPAKETLILARANFALQREAIDVRLFARAASDSRDSASLEELRSWCASTGFRDRLVESILVRVNG